MHVSSLQMGGGQCIPPFSKPVCLGCFQFDNIKMVTNYFWRAMSVATLQTNRLAAWDHKMMYFDNLSDRTMDTKQKMGEDGGHGTNDSRS